MGLGGERRYKKERAVHQSYPRQKQVEAMLQKSGRPRLTGKKNLPSRQNKEKKKGVECHSILNPPK